jgi:hypothetical protein
MAVRLGDHDNVFLISNDILEIYDKELKGSEFATAFEFVKKYAMANRQDKNREYISLQETHLGHVD